MILLYALDVVNVLELIHVNVMLGTLEINVNLQFVMEFQLVIHVLVTVLDFVHPQTIVFVFQDGQVQNVTLLLVMVMLSIKLVFAAIMEIAQPQMFVNVKQLGLVSFVIYLLATESFQPVLQIAVLMVIVLVQTLAIV
jgi:hypothetical protein